MSNPTRKEWDQYARNEATCQRAALERDLAESKQLITSYQIAKDNLELRLASVHEDGPCQECMAAISRANEDYPTWQVY